MHSWIVSRHPTDGDDGAPAWSGSIDLDEGVRLVSNLVDLSPSTQAANEHGRSR